VTVSVAWCRILFTSPFGLSVPLCVLILLAFRVEGKRLFSCPPRHAVFVRTDKVTIGDFPEEDLMGDDEDEI